MERTIRHAASGLLAALVLSVPAVAAQHPNDRAGAQGVGAVSASQARASGATQSLRPDGRELPDGVDLPPAPPTVVAGADSFDWGDAGIGVAGGLGLALIVGAFLTTKQHPRGVSRA